MLRDDCVHRLAQTADDRVLLAGDDFAAILTPSAFSQLTRYNTIFGIAK